MRASYLPDLQPLIWALAILVVVIGVAVLVVTILGTGEGDRGRNARALLRILARIVHNILSCLVQRRHCQCADCRRAQR